MNNLFGSALNYLGNALQRVPNTAVNANSFLPKPLQLSPFQNQVVQQATGQIGGIPQSVGRTVSRLATPQGRGQDISSLQTLPEQVHQVFTPGQTQQGIQNVVQNPALEDITNLSWGGSLFGGLAKVGMARMDTLLSQHPQLQTGAINFNAPISVPLQGKVFGGKLPSSVPTQEHVLPTVSKIPPTVNEVVSKVKQTGLQSLTPEEKSIFKTTSVNKITQARAVQDQNIGKMQESNQLLTGKPALANFDQAIRNKNYPIAVKVAQGMINNPKYADYQPGARAMLSIAQKAGGNEPVRFLKTPPEPQNIPGQVENPALDRITQAQNNVAKVNASRIEASRARLQQGKPQPNQLADFEKSVASSPKETQAYFDKNGNKLYQTESGGARTARMPVEDQSRLTGAVVSSHNHQLVDKANPTSKLNQIATAPDKYDMQQALVKGIKEVRTVHPNGTTSVKFPDNLDQVKIGQAIHQSTIDGENAYRAAIAKGENPFYANVARVEAENNAIVNGLGAKVTTTVNKAVDRPQPNSIQKATSFLNSKEGQKGGINFSAPLRAIGRIFGKGKQPVSPVLPKPTLSAGVKERGFVTTVKESPVAPQQLKDLVSGTYDVKANTDLVNAANARIAKDPVAATNFATKDKSDEGVATAIQLIKQLTAKGDFQTAADIANTKAEQLTEAGRTIQAASLFDSLSPEGIAQMAARTIQKYNITARQKIPELTGEQLAKFAKQAALIRALPAGSRVQDMARQKMLESIARLTPTGPISKGLGIWRAGLLTGPQTVTKILTSHAAMAGLEYLKNIPAKAIDEVFQIFTGQRGLTPTLKGIKVGTRQGITDALDNFLHGYEAPHSGGFAHDFKNTVNYGNSFFGKATQNYVDGIGRLHGSLYKPFFGGAHLNSLYDQALTTAANQKLTGDAAKRFVLDFVKSPPKEAMDLADKEAQIATFQQKTFLGQIASGFQRKAGPAGKIIAPFTRIPSAILTDAVDYSPVGTVKSVMQAVQRGQFTQASQRELSQGLGRSVTGTGIVAIGAALYEQGMIALDRPASGRAAAQWDLEGKKAQAVKIDGQWKNLAALGPLGHVLGMGGYFQEGMQEAGLGQAIGNSVLGLAKITLDQPYLTQLSNISQAVQQPQQKALQEGKSLASSVVPTIAGTIARATDPLQRQTNTIPEAVATKIPGLREQLLPQQNVFGQNKTRSGGVAQNLFDPFQSYTDTSGQSTGDPVSVELGRLNLAGNAATPMKLNKNQTLYGVKQTLTPTQLSQLNQVMGSQVHDVLAKLIQTPAYQQMTDEEKQAEIGKVVAKTHATVRNTFNQANLNKPLPKYVKPKTVSTKPKAFKAKSLFSTKSSSKKGLFHSTL